MPWIPTEFILAVYVVFHWVSSRLMLETVKKAPQKISASEKKVPIKIKIDYLSDVFTDSNPQKYRNIKPVKS